MAHILIDRIGTVWSGVTAGLLAAYDTPRSGGEFSDYAIQNLGFIALYEFNRSVLIKLRSDVVSTPTVEACLNRLKRTNYARYVVEDASAASMVLHTSLVTVERALYRVGLAPGQLKLKDYIVEASSEALPPAVVQLQRALMAAPIDFTDTAALASLSSGLRQIFGDRYIVAQADDDTSPLVFRALGRELFSAFDNSWSKGAIGSPVALIHDAGYGSAVTASYKTALDQGVAAHDKVDAIVNWPELGQIRRRYRRVIVPTRGPDGQHQLISASAIDTSIDLRAPRRGVGK